MNIFSSIRSIQIVAKYAQKLTFGGNLKKIPVCSAVCLHFTKYLFVCLQIHPAMKWTSG